MQRVTPARPRPLESASAAALFRWNPIALSAAGLAYAVLCGVYGVFTPSRDFVPWLVLAIIQVSWVMTLFLTGLAAMTVKADGRPPSFVDCLRMAFTNVEAVNRVNFRAGLAELRAAVTIVGLPRAANLLVRWFFQAHAVFEGYKGSAALDYSSSLLDGRWWPTYRWLLVIWAVALLPICIVFALQITTDLSFPVIILLRIPALAFAFVYHLCAITALYNQLKQTRITTATMAA